MSSASERQKVEMMIKIDLAFIVCNISDGSPRLIHFCHRRLRGKGRKVKYQKRF
jgi:hypothetical protein